MKRILGFIFLLFVLFSCKKATDRICVKSAGKISEEIRLLTDFHSLEIGSKLSVTLVQDSANFVTVNGGKNLLNFIETEVVNGRLILRNENKCHFLRDLSKKVKLELHYRDLDSLFLNNTEPVHMANLLKGDRLYALYLKASSTMNLWAEVDELMVVTGDTWANYILRGKVKSLVAVVIGNCYLEAQNLEVTQKILAKNWSEGDMHLPHFSGDLHAEIERNGNIYYSGNPSPLTIIQKGTGQLIKR